MLIDENINCNNILFHDINIAHTGYTVQEWKD